MNKPNLSHFIFLTTPLIPLMALAPAYGMNGTEARQQLGLEPYPVVEAALQDPTQSAQTATPELKQPETVPSGNPAPEPTTPPTVDQKATPSDGDVKTPVNKPIPLPSAPPAPNKQSVPPKGSQSSPPGSELQTQIPNPDVKLSPVVQPDPLKPSPQTLSISFTSSPLPKTPAASKPIAVAPVKTLPSLTSPEGYARVVLLPKPIASADVPSLPETPPTVQPVTESQIPVAFPIGLQPLMQELGQKVALLYPLINPMAVTSPFGWRVHPISGTMRFHSGVDLASPLGSPVLAAFSGRVLSAGWLGGYGNVIVLEHGQVRSLYAHLSESLATPGQFIPQGAVIGLSGSTGNSTGPHLHFEEQRLVAGEWTAVDPGTDLKTAQRGLMAAMQKMSRLHALK